MLAGQVAPFAAVVYGTAAFVVETIFRLFWTLRNVDVGKARQKGKNEGLEQGRIEGLAQGRLEGREEALRENQEQQSDQPGEE